MQCVENQIQKNYKKWVKLAKVHLKSDGEDFVSSLIEKFLTDQRLMDMACRGNEMDSYVCGAIFTRKLVKGRTYVGLIEVADEAPAVDEMEFELKWSRVALAMRALPAGERAMIEWYLYGNGSLRYLAEKIGEDFEFLQHKMERTKQKLIKLAR